ncbi:MAG TPA: hypothetical protein DF712_22250 [Balneola sp.]|nr:hypothetical protein [Balneola sp.]HCT55180.1 hypothetical protein [Balneola sp.]|tara:strand:- start:1932 stop:2549 length:618 start_codon:yes stop_codon:yes gene_type:complete
MSEVTMFSANKKYEKAGGVSISGLGADKSGELASQGEASMREYQPSFGFSYFRNFFIYDPVQTNKGAVSLSIGKSTGMDATVQIFRPIYFTAAASMPKNLMGSVLFRITDEDWGGVSIGPVIRQQSFNFKEDESFNIYAPVLPDGHENFGLIGIRSSLIFTPQSFSMPWSDSFVLITLEGGRFMDLNDNYLSISVTFGDLIKYRE